MLLWRELALNFSLRNPHFGKLRALPDWAVRSMQRHVVDEREFGHSLAQLERAESHEPLWNAAQRELVRTGTIHNIARMLWGKSALLWTRRYVTALRFLVYLNKRYALDGRDPSSYGGFHSCRKVRSGSGAPSGVGNHPPDHARAREKFDVDAYVRRWTS